MTMLYPELHDVPIADGYDVVLDGEVAEVAPDTGAVEFEAVMERFLLRKQRLLRLRNNPVGILELAVPETHHRTYVPNTM